MLEPSLLQMICIAEEIGLKTLEQAYTNYMRQYDLFFLVSDYENQYKVFADTIRKYNFTDREGFLKDLSLEECRDIIQSVENNDKT